VSADNRDYVADYLRDGYAIIRDVFSEREIETIGAAADQVYAEGVRHGRSFRHGNLFYNVAPDADGTPFVRMAQWPSYHQPVLNGVRLDRRMAQIVEPLIGRDLKQIINQIHWKASARRAISPGTRIRASASRPGHTAISALPMCRPDSPSIRIAARPAACASFPGASATAISASTAQPRCSATR
jgi:hypothetical protein